MTELDANADLLRRQREIIDRKTLKPFTKRRDLPGLLYFFWIAWFYSCFWLPDISLVLVQLVIMASDVVTRHNVKPFVRTITRNKSWYSVQN